MRKTNEELLAYLKPRKMMLGLWIVFGLIALMPLLIGGALRLNIFGWAAMFGNAIPVLIIIFTAVIIVALVCCEFFKLPEQVEKYVLPITSGVIAVADLVFWIVLATQTNGGRISFWYILGYVILALIVTLCVFAVIGLVNLDTDLITWFKEKKTGKKSKAPIVCAKCGELIPAGSQFCQKCGTPVPGPVQCPNCGETVGADSMFCPKCGTKVRE